MTPDAVARADRRDEAVLPLSLLSSIGMDVFVIPVARDSYELYCESESPAGPDGETETPASAGWLERGRRWVASFLRSADQRNQRPPAADDRPQGWFGRLHDRMMAWVAERIAEQRLLWNLRNRTTATVVHPQDMTFEQAMTLVTRMLRRDYERHQRWMIVDGILFILAFVVLGPLFLLVPGVANLPALYFGFRVVGHWFSMRGASQGLQRVVWTGRPCAPLGELRDIAGLEPTARGERLHDIAARLRLPHLVTFLDRVSVPQG